MKLAILLLAFIAMSAYAAEDPKHAKARAACDKQAEAAANKAVAETPMQHPQDVAVIKQRAKQNEVSKCMRLAGYASGPIRAK